VEPTSKVDHQKSAADHSRLPRRIAILGGGVTGLTALYMLARARRDGASIELFLVEASERLGGVIQTERVQEFIVESGPDSFLSEKPEAAALAEELGLGDQLAGSDDVRRRTYILHKERLVPLPEGLMLFVPRRIAPVLRSPLLPLSSRVAVVRDFFRRPAKQSGEAGDESVAQMVCRHFGRGMLENIADPLLEGIYGGDAKHLSARSVLPRFCTIEKEYGSLARGMMKSRGRNNASRPLFTTIRGGLDRLVHKLAEEISAGANTGECPFLLGARVTDLQFCAARQGPATYAIHCADGRSFSADSVILALPAFECGRLLHAICPSLAGYLDAIPYTPAVTVSLAYAARPSGLPQGFGFLVPRTTGHRLLACTFVHHKFPFRAPAGSALLRCFLGGARDPEAVELSDEALLPVVRHELRSILGITESPAFWKAYRWPRAMPQYIVGHKDLVGKIEAEVATLPGLFIAGNAYSGVGISDCIRSARAAAARALKVATSE
jgi:protoporphyrinogen/coproporphyrinogen III oxidase